MTETEVYRRYCEAVEGLSEGRRDKIEHYINLMCAKLLTLRSRCDRLNRENRELRRKVESQSIEQ